MFSTPIMAQIEQWNPQQHKVTKVHEEPVPIQMTPKPDSTTSELGEHPTLSELCHRYNSDKCSNQHNFIEYYERLFASQRDSIKRFFEIGILNGASHMIWRDYFNDDAKIFGIDLRDYSYQQDKGNIFTFVADQANRGDLQKFIDAYGGDFDVILDDGGHAMDHQQVSLGFLFKHVKPGGYFIIEDVHTSLPEFYNEEYFGVNKDGTNTTLYMIEQYIRTSRIMSQYMTPEEMMYLQLNIENIELNYRTNGKHSTMCIIHKKEVEVLQP
jgi:SAM-dependent methyltransferase